MKTSNKCPQDFFNNVSQRYPKTNVSKLTQRWQYYRHYYREYFFKISLAGVLSFSVCCLNIGILILIRSLFNNFPNFVINSNALHVGGLIITLYIVRAGISLKIGNNILIIGQKTIQRFLEEILNKFNNLPISFFKKLDKSSCHASIIQDTTRIHAMNNAIIFIISLSFMSIGVLVYLLFLNKLFFVLLLTIVIIPFCITKLIGKKLAKSFESFHRSFEKFSKGILFVLQKIEFIRIQAADKIEFNTQKFLISDYCSRQKQNNFYKITYGEIHNSLIACLTIIVLLVGINAVKNEILSLGELITFYSGLMLIRFPLTRIFAYIPVIIEGNASFDTLFSLLQIKDRLPYFGTKKIVFNGEIKLSSVSFQYDDDNTLLNNLDLTFKPGSINAILGKNGVGKTTIVNLILGFIYPDKGKLFADNISYDELDMEQLRKQIGVVPQDPVIISGTVLENLIYGMPDLNLEEVICVCKQTKAYDFIQKLPSGFQTQIEQDGSMLSGGQKQLISITRALLRKPKLLILDELSNHLDNSMIHIIMNKLKSITKNTTIILIIHNKNLIQYADTVYNLEAATLNCKTSDFTTITGADKKPTIKTRENMAPVSFFNEVFKSYLKANNVGGCTLEYYIEISGSVIKLSFTGPSLVPKLMPAISHLTTNEKREPDLTICIWDSETSGVAMPPPPWQKQDYIARSEIKGFNKYPIKTAYQLDSGNLTMLDHDRNLGLFWIDSANDVPYYETGAPLRSLLYWWLAARNMQYVHAAAVGNLEYGGVLLAGKGGSGKSTSSISTLLTDNLQFAGDDYCVLESFDGLFAHSIYSTAKINQKSIDALPQFEKAIIKPQLKTDEKHLLDINKFLPQRLIKKVSIRAVLLPKITGVKSPTIKPTGPGECLRSLAPSTIFQLPYAGREDFMRLSKMVEKVPAFTLELGDNPEEIGPLILDLLKKI
ncbi:ABC transporter ATP-binding protein [Candidatus Margulisiibacteriota bacterium]